MPRRFASFLSRFVEQRPTNPWRLASVALTTAGVGCAVLLTVANHLVSLDGASLDEGETVHYLMPLSDGRRVWQGSYTVEGRDRDGRLKLKTPDGRTIHASDDEVAGVNRW